MKHISSIAKKFLLFLSFSLSLFLIIPSLSFGEVLFFDNFSNNSKDWYEESNSEIYAKVSGGKYVFSHKRDKDAWFSWQSVYLNESQDYEIEVTLKKNSGIQNYGAGLFWGSSDLDNRYSFLITANGFYKFFKYEGGTRGDFIDWKTSYLINQGNGKTNTIKVQKKGNKLKFYINDSYVDEYAFQGHFGDRFGFEVDNKSKITFDDIKVSQTRATTTATTTSYTKNEDKQTLFNDDFSTNKNDWYEKSTGEVAVHVRGGEYVFDHKREKDAWFSWQSVPISDDKDFTISTSSYKKSGVENYGYGIFWGASDLDNRFSYLITANGYYKVFKYVGGTREDLIDWTESSIINQGNGSRNTLSVEKKGDILKFYINGTYVAQHAYQKKFGNDIGFEVDNKSKVHFDNFLVTQSSPTYQKKEQIEEKETYIVERDTAPPKIVITSSNITRGIKIVETKKRIKVAGIATDKSGIVEVLINDREAHLDASGNFSANVYLRMGQNKITVRAMDTYENVSTKEYTVLRESSVMLAEDETVKEVKKTSTSLNWYAKQHALVVGIDQYQNSSIPTLQNAVNDAKSISSMLRNMDFTVAELYNDGASRKNILRELKKIRKNIKKEDSVIIYFAGHGQGLKLSTGKKTGYIIPYDSDIDLQGNSVIDYDEEAISLDYLKKIASDLSARHIALLLDSCFSGLAMKRSIPGPSSHDIEYYNDILSRRAINILTAGDDQPVSDGSGHSPFAKALLQALQDKGADIRDRDGYVTFNQLSSYVKEKVEKATSRRQRPQFDNLIDDDGDFVFKVR